MVANVTDMKTREALLRFTSNEVPRAVGTTTNVKKNRVVVSISS